MIKNNNRKIIIFIAVIMLLIFLHLTRILLPVENFIFNIFNPVLKTFYSTGSSFRDNYNEKIDKKDLLEISNKLQEDNSRIIAENSRLKAIEVENGSLRKYLNFFEKEDQSFILANIISRKGLDIFSLGESVVINRGSLDGLKRGLVVVNSNGIIIGKILSTKESLSEICLVIDNDCRLAIAVQGKEDTLGIAEGELGLTIKIDFIPQTADMTEGDIVITSGLEDNIPRGMVLGKVESVNSESNKLWQSATVDSLASFDNLTMVSVLLPSE